MFKDHPDLSQPNGLTWCWRYIGLARALFFAGTPSPPVRSAGHSLTIRYEVTTNEAPDRRPVEISVEELPAEEARARQTNC